MPAARRAVPPPTVIAFVGTILLTMLVFLAVNGVEHERRLLAAAPGIILLLFGLWRGWWLVWILWTGLFVINIPTVAAEAAYLWAIPVNLALLALLLAPPTRRWIAARAPRRVARLLGGGGARSVELLE